MGPAHVRSVRAWCVCVLGWRREKAKVSTVLTACQPLADRAAIILHDTNMPPSLEYERKDGTKGVSWDNKRGVARAVAEFVGTTFDEQHW